MSEPRVEYKVWIEIEEIHRDGLEGDEETYVADPMPQAADECNTREEAEDLRQRLLDVARLPAEDLEVSHVLDQRLWESEIER